MNIHPTAEVQTSHIGSSTLVWQYTIILQGAQIGNNCNINAHCFIENDVSIGDNVTVKCGVSLWDGITLEDNVFIGPNAVFTNDVYPRSRQQYMPIKTIVKRGASIGANATVIAGATIGEYAMIGAGSVITKNVPNNTLWFGNPARQAGFVCNCGHRLDEDLQCNSCNTKYRLLDNKVVRYD
jgi:acetyltransferase-like isoleucine patch superfamily enzyme